MEADGHAGTRLIKRYANRKLYDTETSRYVTLQQIAAMIREGDEVSVIDNTSKEDLTSVTFAQIIYEAEKASKNGNSTAKLKEFIERRGEKLMTSLREGPVGKFVPESPQNNPAQKLLTQSRDAVEELQRKADGGLRGIATVVGRQLQQVQAEVGRLQARIEELEGKLGRRKNAGDKSPGSDSDSETSA